MTTHTVHATITVEVTDNATLQRLGGGAGDERSQVEAAAKAGLRELPSVAQRYGFRITDTDVSVD